jgi:hypothetical protein
VAQHGLHGPVSGRQVPLGRNHRRAGAVSGGKIFFPDWFFTKK